MTAAPTSASNASGLAPLVGNPTAHFTHYLENSSLPVSHAEVRQAGQNDVLVTLVSHLPSDGLWFDAIDDLIVSIVMKSDHSSVTRDVGFGKQQFIERPGCILITPPRTPSYWDFHGNPNVLHLSVPSRHLPGLTGCDSDDLAAMYLEAARRPIYDRLVSQLSSQIWASMAGREHHAPNFSYHALGTVMSLLLARKTRAARQSPAATNAVQPLASWRVQRALRYMSESATERPLMRDVAEHVGLSTDHFVRAFAATTGKTPFQWQSEARIEESKRLLADTNVPITEVALYLGFASSAHFATRFKQIVGLTPSAWRSSFVATRK